MLALASVTLTGFEGEIHSALPLTCTRCAALELLARFNVKCIEVGCATGAVGDGVPLTATALTWGSFVLGGAWYIGATDWSRNATGVFDRTVTGATFGALVCDGKSRYTRSPKKPIINTTARTSPNRCLV